MRQTLGNDDILDMVRHVVQSCRNRDLFISKRLSFHSPISGRFPKKKIMTISKLETTAILGTVALSLAVFIGLEIANVVLDDQDVWDYCQHPPPDVLKWCEAADADPTHFMVEPANARSNYPYFIFGVYCVLWGLLTWKNQNVKKVGGIGRSSGNLEGTVTAQEADEISAVSSATGSAKGNHAGSNTDDSSIDNSLDNSLDNDDIELGHDSDEGKICVGDINGSHDSSCAAPGDAKNWLTVEDSQHLSLLHQFPILPISFGISLIFLAFGSWWYHASECRVANSWDAAGMYAVTCFPLFYCLVALVPYLQHPIGVLIVPALQLFFFIGEFELPFDDHLTTQMLIIGSFVMMTILTIKRRKTHTFRYWLAGACVLAAGIGYGMWHLDKKGVMCEPMLGHPIWHIGTCLAIMFGGFYLRSQRLREPPTTSLKSRYELDEKPMDDKSGDLTAELSQELSADDFSSELSDDSSQQDSSSCSAESDIFAPSDDEDDSSPV